MRLSCLWLRSHADYWLDFIASQQNTRQRRAPLSRHQRSRPFQSSNSTTQSTSRMPKITSKAAAEPMRRSNMVEAGNDGYRNWHGACANRFGTPGPRCVRPGCRRCCARSPQRSRTGPRASCRQARAPRIRRRYGQCGQPGRAQYLRHVCAYVSSYGPFAGEAGKARPPLS